MNTDLMGAPINHSRRTMPALNVLVLIADGAPLSELAAFETAFTQRDAARPYNSTPTIAAPGQPTVRSDLGLELQFPTTITTTAAVAQQADIVGVTSRSLTAMPDEAAAWAVKHAAANGANFEGLGTGASLLAAAGVLLASTTRTVLDRRRDSLDRTRTHVQPLRPSTAGTPRGRSLTVVTASGHSAAHDAREYLLPELVGVPAAAWYNRELDLRRRDVFSAVLSRSTVPSRFRDPISDATSWAEDNLSSPITVDDLARRAAMSPRTFVRNLQARYGTTPYAWVTQRRLAKAPRLLDEEPQTAFADIANRRGFSSTDRLRMQLVDHFGMSPNQYRSLRRYAGLVAPRYKPADHRRGQLPQGGGRVSVSIASAAR